jgi:tetratricopeptide (TPR) repeat protein
MRLFTDPEGRGDEAQRVTEEAVQVFRELGDDRSLVRAVTRTHWALFQRGELTAQREALAAALPHAVRAGDLRLETNIRSLMITNRFWDHTPLAEVEIAIQELVAHIGQRGFPLRENQAYRILAGISAMRGEVAEARKLMRRADAIAADLGPSPLLAMAQAEWQGYIEQLAGDYAAAEKVQRSGYDTLEGYGERGYRSTLAGELGESLYELGRYDEAFEFAEQGRQAAATDDVGSQALWRCVQAKVLARRSEFAEAERLAREGVELIGSTEFLMHHAWALEDLGEVLRLADRPEEAADAFHRALELYEHKGMVVMAERTRERLAELAIA